jgi:Uncharacterized conserved protein
MTADAMIGDRDRCLAVGMNDYISKPIKPESLYETLLRWLKPDDIHTLMSGLIESHKRIKAGNVSPIIHATAIAYGFVFLHPFEDGNGRIHRFLIHNILALGKMVPHGLMFPVSAIMLKIQLITIYHWRLSRARCFNALMLICVIEALSEAFLKVDEYCSP